jgi:hypothetical protein
LEFSLAQKIVVVTGLAGIPFLQHGHGTFITDLVESPDGTIPLSENVIFRIHLLRAFL